MKKYWLIALLGLTAASFGQQAENNELTCDCPSCREKAASGKEFTLPGLQGLDTKAEPEAVTPPEQTGLPSEPEACGDCDHDHGTVEPADHDHDHDSHAGHDHAEDPHADCDHGYDVHDHGDHEEGGVELAAEVVQKTGIRVQEARGGTIAKTTVFPAEIKLNRDRAASVSPRYASVVRQVFVEIGDTVRKGDTLASLENRETMAVYNVAAPLDGVILSKDLAVGESAGEDRVLYEVADLSSVWADISIFPKYQHLLRKGLPVEFIAHDGHAAQSVVKYISPIVSHETRTFTARCVLKSAGEDFTPGAFVRARINIETADVAVVVPREAVLSLEGENIVFVPGDHGFQPVEVELGLVDEYNVQIRSGLKPGDPYVAAGAFALKAQMVTSGMDPHAGHGH